MNPPERTAGWAVVVCAAILYPPVGLPVLGIWALVAFRHRSFEGMKAWLVVAALMVPLMAIQLAAGQDIRWLAAFAAVIALGGTLAKAPRQSIVAGGMVALTIVAATLGAERVAAMQTWRDTVEPQSLVERFGSVVTGSQRLSGGVWDRSWTLPPASDAVRLAFDARLSAGTPGVAWFRYHPDFAVEPGTEGGTAYSRVTPPQGGGSYITRRVDTGSPIAGRTFRVKLELRSDEPLATAGCSGVLLREVRGRGGYACLPVELATKWREHSLTWTPPPRANSHILRVELRIPARKFDVRRVVLEERVDNEWIEHAPLAPTGVFVALVVPGQEEFHWPVHGFTPTEEWQTANLSFGHVDAALPVRLALRVEEGIVVQVRDVRLVTADGSRAKPLSAPSRQRLWHAHPNLAAHGVAAAGLTLLTAARSGAIGLVGAALALGSIALTASRTAFAGLLLGAPWMLWLATPQRHRTMRTAIVYVVILGLVAALGVGSLDRLRPWRLQDGNNVSRMEIWSTAWSAMQREPWSGTGAGGFERAWRAVNPADPRDVPTHAHNLWLQWGAIYGWPGFATALALAASLVWIGWRRGHWRGLALVLPLLLMQAFDYTLVYSAVLVPLILALNALAGRTEQTQRPGDGDVGRGGERKRTDVRTA